MKPDGPEAHLRPSLISCRNGICGALGIQACKAEIRNIYRVAIKAAFPPTEKLYQHVDFFYRT
jgi:hypothetical protein